MTSTCVENPSRARPDGPDAGAARGPGRRTRVCFVAPAAWPLLAGDPNIPVIGGAELQQVVVATELARRGYEVSMISLDYGQQEGSRIDGVRVLKMHRPDDGLPVVRFVHPRLTSLWSAMKRADADVYYQRCAASTTGFMAAFCRRYGRKSIHSGASDIDFIPGKQDIAFARDRFLHSWGVRHVDALFAQNPYQQQALREHYGRDSVLMSNCYAPPAGANADPRGYVLWVATMRATKRPELMVELARRLPHLPFVMAGGDDGGPGGKEYGRAIRAAAAALPNVTVHGFVPFAQAERLFDGARVVVNTSPYEGFPNTFLQAWARGAPTVAFVDTGSREDGGPVYDVVPDMDTLCARVDRLMKDDAAWSAASTRVRGHFARNHSVAAIVGHYESEIDRLVAGIVPA